MIEYDSLIQWAFFGMAGFIGTSMVAILYMIWQTMSELNLKIAVIITKSEAQEERLDAHEEKIIVHGEKISGLEAITNKP